MSSLPSKASLAQAVDLFVMTKFEQCFQACCDVIKACKCEPEQERNLEVIEAATALGIQALAEMDQWQNTVSFITEVYGSVHLCSARIVQVCILLHAHVEEYLPCHKLVQTWLKHPENSSSKHCAQVIRVYSHHILLPTGQFGILEDITTSCKSLTEEERANLLQLPEAGHYEDAKQIRPKTCALFPHHFLNSDASYSTEAKSTSNDVDGKGEGTDYFDRVRASTLGRVPSAEIPRDKEPASVLDLCKKLYSSFLGSISCRWRERFIVVVLSLFAIWALIQTQTGDPVSSIGRFFVLGKGLLQRLKSLLQMSH